MTATGAGQTGTRPLPVPTGLAATVFGAGLVLAMLALATADLWLLLLACAAAGALLVAAARAPRVDGLRYCYAVPGPAVVGQRTAHRLHVHNRDSRRSPLTRLTIRTPGLADAVLLVEPLPPGGVATVDLPRDAVARGVTDVCHIAAESTAPFGLLRAASAAAYRSRQVVHPALVPAAPAPPGGGADGDGPPQRSRTGLDVAVVREWRAGDDRRRLHRRASARHGRLLVVDREEPTGGRAAILVAGPAGGPGWEPLVAVVASVAVATAAQGRCVLLAARQDGLSPAVDLDAGPLLDWCAALTAPGLPGAEEMAAAVRHVGPGGTVLVASTPDLDPGVWPALQAAAAGRVTLLALHARATAVPAGVPAAVPPAAPPAAPMPPGRHAAFR